LPRLPALNPERAGGANDNLIRTIAAQPRLARSVDAHRALLMEGGRVPAETKELCAAMVAALTFCNPLLVAHRGRARNLGAAAETLNDLWDYARSDRYTGAQKAALAAAVALTREPRGLPDAVWNELREHYDDGQIVELMCVIGFANYLDRVSNALQTEIDHSN
jgi:AhpD family alkylhydroperoxidase